MKKYYVTVNGTRYEVEVEEVKGEFSPSVAAAPTVSVEPKPSTPKEAPPVAKETPKPAAPAPAAQPAAAAKAEGDIIECPMPGTILRVNVSEGSTVKKGDVILVLEAMKMENEIMAPRDGKIVQVSVAKGAVVNTGDTLAVIQ